MNPLKSLFSLFSSWKKRTRRSIKKSNTKKRNGTKKQRGIKKQKGG